MTVISLLGLILACPSGGSSGSTPTVKYTPKAADYTVTPADRNFTYDGTAKSVTVTPKEGASPGAGYLTPKYNGSTTAPSAKGLYEITIDVAASGDWEAVTDLLVASMAIKDPGKDDLTLENFDISDFPKTMNVNDPVSSRPTVRVKAGINGVSNSDIKLFYNGNENFPNQAGAYAVTFNVNPPATSNYNPITGLGAGLLTIKDSGAPSPVTEIDFLDFTFKVGDRADDVFAGPTTELPVVYSDDDLPLHITGKTQKGDRYIATGTLATAIITYWQKNPVEGRPDIQVGYPKDVGSYTIKVNLPAYVNVNNDDAFNGLYFELPLKVTIRTPNLGDFDVSNNRQAEASVIMQQQINVTDVVITSKYSSLNTTPVIQYNVNGTWGTTIPQTRGEYDVRFSIVKPTTGAGAGNWDKADNIDAGKLTVVPLDAVNPSFTGDYLFWVDGGVLTLNKDLQYINPGQTITFTMASPAYTVLEWWEDGKKVATSGNTWSFSKTALEWHSVAVVVSYDGKLYSASVDFRVQTEK